MGPAIDTIVGTATNPGATGAAVTMNVGDSATIRNIPDSAFARLDYVSRQGATEGFVEIKSPRMADAVRGFHVILTETPGVRLMPQHTGQAMYPADATTISVSGGSAEVDAIAAGIFYSDLPGVNAQVKMWSDIQNSIVNIKPVEVDISAQGTSGAWSDTVLTTTENLLKANIYYALLGYVTDTAILCAGIKGPETGNLRLCGPGPTTTIATDEYFIFMSERHGAPYIPVVNANNRANLFCSTALVSTSATPKIELVFAELSANYQP